MKYECYGASELGGRKNQEDAFFYKELPGSTGVFAAVADGMGGHAAGEVASQTAIQVLQTSDAAHLQDRFDAAQTAVKIVGRSDPSKAGLGCTLTAIVLSTTTKMLSWCHIGDSRLTLIRGGRATWLTKDHSIGGSLLHHGHITEREFENGECAQGIVAYIGMAVDRNTTFLSNVDSGSVKAIPGDVFILSSDGVQGPLRKNDVLAIVNGTPGSRGTWAKNICRALLTKALKVHGATNEHTDNATCIVLIVS